MPRPSFPFPLAPASRLQRLYFHHSVRRLSHDTPNHYETLNIPTTATPNDVKKSFYKLSKTHHPDRNPNDPEAATRFVKISEAYDVLGTPAKREKYDRDFLRISHAHSSSHAAGRPAGSYHSSGPAGGRPASGLSRRRTQFKGPPQSFYRNGGWGEYGAKRQAAQEGMYNAPPSGQEAQGMGGTGGMGPGQQPFPAENNVPHFDHRAHFKTHHSIYKQQKRKREAKSDRYREIGPPPGILAPFLFVAAVISITVFVPSLVFDRNPKKKGDS